MADAARDDADEHLARTGGVDGDRLHLRCLAGRPDDGAERLARRFGATDVVDASAGDPVAAVRALTGGEGVDLALEATGVPSVVSQAVAMLARGGTAVAIGVPPPESSVTIRWSGGDDAAYPTKTTLRITDGGDPTREDLERWIGWGADGRLDLDGMVTRELELTDADLAKAFRSMLAGEVIRSVVRMPAP